MRYQKLLSPIMVGGQIIKNRLTYPNASPHFLQGPETYPAEGYRHLPPIWQKTALPS